MFICDFNVPVLINEHTQENIEFNFFDVINNSYKLSEQITILKTVSSDISTPNCVDVVAGDFYPAKINRVALDLAQTNSLSYPTYAPFVIEKKGGSVCRDIKLNEIKIDNCWITSSNDSLIPAFGNYFDDGSSIKYPYRAIEEKNYLDVPIGVEPNAIDSTTLICNFSVLVSDDEIIYSEPLNKQAEWEVELVNSALGRPGKNYVDSLRESQKRLDELHMKAFGFANDVLATSSRICLAGTNARNVVNNLQLATDVYTYAKGKASAIANTVIKDSAQLTNIGNALKTNDIEPNLEKVKINDEQLVDKVLGTLGDVIDLSCEFSSCSLGNYLEGESLIGGKDFSNLKESYNYGGSIGLGDPVDYDRVSEFGGAWEKTVGDVTGNLGVPDLYNSIVACIANNCWSGVVYHLNQYREAECDRLYCLKRQAQKGLSIDSCDISMKTFLCKKLTGEFFEIPYARQAKNLADNLNHAIQNFIPQFLMDTISSGACTPYYEEVISNPAAPANSITLLGIIKCEVPLAIGRQIRNSRISSRAGSFSYPVSEVDICKLAMCNKENPEDCNTESGMSWFNEIMPDNLKAIAYLDSGSAYDQMIALQENKRGTSNGKYYGNSIIHYANLMEDCRNEKCINKKIKDLSLKLEFDYGLKLPDSYDKFETAVGGSMGFTNEAGTTYIINQMKASQFGFKPDTPENEPAKKTTEEDIIAQQKQEVENGKEATLNIYLGGDAMPVGSLDTNAFSIQLIEKYQKDEKLDDIKSFTDLYDEANQDYSVYGYKVSAKKQEQIKILANNPPESIKDLAAFKDEEDDFSINEWKKFIKNPEAYGQETYKVYYIDENENKYYFDEGQELTKEQVQEYIKDGYKISSGDTKDEYNPWDSQVKADTKADSIKKNVINIVKEKNKENTAKLSQKHEEEKRKLKDAKDREDFLRDRAKAKKVIDMVVRWAWDNYLKDVGSLGYLGSLIKEKTGWSGLEQFSEFLEDNLNSESWKNSLCNPQVSPLYSISTEEGSAIDCTGNYCNTVLSMAMERAPYNWTSDEDRGEPDNYIYTFVYQMGPIKDENEYNIYFKIEEGEDYCVFKNNRGNCVNKELKVNDIEGDTVAFISDNYYVKVCFKFNKEFPEREVQRYKKEYCRTIAESDFSTGQPDRDFDIDTDLSNESQNNEINTLYG
jgi:hypothetical protein